MRQGPAPAAGTPDAGLVQRAERCAAMPELPPQL